MTVSAGGSQGRTEVAGVATRRGGRAQGGGVRQPKGRLQRDCGRGEAAVIDMDETYSNRRTNVKIRRIDEFTWFAIILDW